MTTNRSKWFKALTLTFVGTVLLSANSVVLLRAQELEPAAPTAPAAAQAAAVGMISGKPATDAELIKRADAILRPIVHDPTKVEGGTVYRVGFRGRTRNIKGPRGMFSWKVFVPEGVNLTFERNHEYLLFATADPAKERLVVFDAFSVQLMGATQAAQIVDQITAEADKDRKLEIVMKTDKPAYASGEPVTRLWQIKNISAAPVTIYIGPYAFQQDYIIDGRAHGSGTGGSHSRTRADFKQLAPGEVYEKKSPVNALVPEGKLGIRMRYVAEDNWVGGETGEGRTRVAEMVFAHEEAEFDVPIGPPSAAVFDAAVKILGSQVWAEQLEAVQFLAVSKKGAALPQVRALATHPWHEVREAVVGALTLGGEPLQPALRDLLFDPDVRVRTEAREKIRNRRIPDASLPLLALKLVTREAVDKALLPPEGKNVLPLIDGELQRLRDLRLGDVLAELMQGGRDNGYVLNFLAENHRALRLNNTQETTEEQRAAVLKAWQEKRQGVANPYTGAQLEAEMARCRTAVFADFKLSPRIAEIRALMEKLHESFSSYGKPEDKQALAAMGKDIVPTTLFIQRNSYSSLLSQALCQLYVEWNAREAVDELLAASYDKSPYAPFAAVSLDSARAYPQIEYLFGQEKIGAAVALLKLGEKRAVPLVVGSIDNATGAWGDELNAALIKATGKTVTQRGEWKKWWETDGANQTWK